MTDERPSLTIALASFDRHIPFFMNWLPQHPNFSLKALDVGINPPGRDGGDRHGRMLRDREFDIAEVSLASYIMARAQGAAFTAVPVFPRRLFSQNHIFVHDASGIKTPRDLIGKRVAIRSFQVTLSVLAKGDLASLYGVPWRSIHWVVQDAEEIAWQGEDLSIERMAAGTKGADLLRRGLVDAYIDPRPPVSLLTDDAVRPLFPDRQAEAGAYFRARGAFPIMHLLVIRQETAEKFEGLPGYLIEAWEDAKAKVCRSYEDPAYTLMPFGSAAYQAAVAEFGPDPWPSGLAANADNVLWFQDYMVDQTLLQQPLPLASLFHSSVLDS
ncbi:ABC transporter substrate-binding protein [Rhizobium sp. ICMP 5592]|uniref:ABC transporter substrate-binding protein n=1 Tax=Rhizobium sp. ICMP 5592 TaxID=2292445 RepID=UPI0012958770|nr:ABC transporter substrate-binding protein [Rhizobium sp. ICMP 5592]MQB45905.1 taurine ABC transporter substrate-binding protein [Rhizobium sp. ICMP 5592]